MNCDNSRRVLALLAWCDIIRFERGPDAGRALFRTGERGVVVVGDEPANVVPARKGMTSSNGYHGAVCAENRSRNRVGVFPDSRQSPSFQDRIGIREFLPFRSGSGTIGGGGLTHSAP